VLGIERLPFPSFSRNAKWIVGKLVGPAKTLPSRTSVTGFALNFLQTQRTQPQALRPTL
jgi:hypothetical protein